MRAGPWTGGQKEHFVLGPKFKEEKKEEKEKYAPGPLFSAALKAGNKIQNRMRKVEIDDKNVVYIK